MSKVGPIGMLSLTATADDILASCKLSNTTQGTKGGVVGQSHPPLPLPRQDGRRCKPRHFPACKAHGLRGLVAQGIERPPPKRQVDGSNPSGVTTNAEKRCIFKSLPLRVANLRFRVSRLIFDLVRSQLSHCGHPRRGSPALPCGQSLRPGRYALRFQPGAHRPEGGWKCPHGCRVREPRSRVDRS